MKKMIPVLIAIVLILCVGGGWLGVILYDKYSYSKERADLGQYYAQAALPDDAQEGTQVQPLAENEAFIIWQDEVIAERAAMREGRCYLTLQQVHRLLNGRFYEDAEEILFYSLPTEVITTQIGSTVSTHGYDAGVGQDQELGYVLSYYEGEGENRTLYVALDYVREYTNFDYTLYTGPNRIQLNTDWAEQSLADIRKDTAIRYQGGIKSPILEDVSQGDTVTVLETMENWSKVKTQDSVIGYVENKRLENVRIESPSREINYMEPEYTNISKDYKISLAWHQVTNMDANGSLAGSVANARGLNTISPTWYSLQDNDGNFSSIASPSYVEQAHAMGLEVWALIDDFNPEVDIYQVLSRSTSRRTLIENLMQQAQTVGFDGINIDFENIDERTGEAFSQFLRELSIRCRQAGIVLSVDNYVPRDHSAHYNRKEQGIVADYVIIMGYDEHWGGGGVAGSVASIGFVEDGILRTLEDVPAEKVINAVPFYTRIWKTENGEVTSSAVGMDNAENFLTQRGVSAEWNEETCQEYAEFEADGILYQVWLENEKSLEVKLNVMQVNQLAGVAAWKLGFERASVWDVIAAYTSVQ